MKIYSLIGKRTWLGLEGVETWIEQRYSCESEAEKHLEWLFNKKLSDKDYSDVEKCLDGGFRCSYDLFKYDNTERYYIECEDIDIKDKFEIPK